MHRPKHWTRHAYPVQTPETKPHNRPPPKTTRTSDPIPKTIRACKDADSYVHEGRTIVVCLDGTGDRFDNDNSNIVHLVSCLKKDHPSQVTYYQSGIGTYGKNGLSTGFTAAIDMAVGSGLGVHVRDAYRFLMQTYREGDKICLFGFSRGAYTARCLAGMLHKVGLLPAENVAQVEFAYAFYKDDTENGWKMSTEFKKTFCIDVSVYFVGVWDCVASVGFIPRKLPFSSTPTSKTGHFRHAMALDEHRAKFKISPWVRKDRKPDINSSNATVIPKPQHLPHLHEALHKLDETPQHALSNGSVSKTDKKEEKRRKKNESEFERQARLEHNGKTVETDVLEVWFTGCHADVGGGAVANEERHMLSRIPLRWMLRQCFECETGILFESAMLAEKGLDVHTLWPVYTPLLKPVVGPSPVLLEKYEMGVLHPIESRAMSLDVAKSDELSEKSCTGGFQTYEAKKLADEAAEYIWTPEQTEDYFDSIAPINDQLVLAKGWWILEFWPIKVRVQKRDSDDWEKKRSINLGRHRAVQDLEPKMHWTVHQRMHTKNYVIRTRVDRNAEWRIVV
ncbi:Hypothetical protein R9X50_00645900 [Acrodontium crateriforme]|uniref:T6SS Phospholipase effector Tle1-like catalytic domain-containing protein n=1 Tax=Acrodontium crateriforme TaxID=150365 RepID=A0AAQ3M9V7_9PEZI|nr:Hypothetical protein R9X50_00645900 [Acrodontium crateriforme]